jgi:hypothetical protein
MKKLIFTLNALFIAGIAFGQTIRLEISQLGIFSQDNIGQAKIYLTQDSQLKDVIMSKIHAEKEYNIWRVQIYMGADKNSRAIGTSTENSFRTKYPDVVPELIYHPPYFKVHVGNFKTKLEAESFKRKIIGDYPNCWVVSEVYKSKN